MLIYSRLVRRVHCNSSESSARCVSQIKSLGDQHFALVQVYSTSVCQNCYFTNERFTVLVRSLSGELVLPVVIYSAPVDQDCCTAIEIPRVSFPCPGAFMISAQALHPSLLLDMKVMSCEDGETKLTTCVRPSRSRAKNAASRTFASSHHLNNTTRGPPLVSIACNSFVLPGHTLDGKCKWQQRPVMRRTKGK